MRKERKSKIRLKVDEPRYLVAINAKEPIAKEMTADSRENNGDVIVAMCDHCGKSVAFSLITASPHIGHPLTILCLKCVAQELVAHGKDESALGLPSKEEWKRMQEVSGIDLSQMDVLQATNAEDVVKLVRKYIQQAKEGTL